MKKIVLGLVSVSLLTACAGRASNPIMSRRIDDYDLTCDEIKFEMRQIEFEMQRLIPQSDKTSKNVGLGVAGLFFFPAWFFMDLSKAEKEEIRAYQQRYSVLEQLAKKRQCSFLGGSKQEKQPSSEN